MAELGLFSAALSDVGENECSEEVRHARLEIQRAGYQSIRTVRWNPSHVALAFTVVVDIPTGGTVGQIDIRPEEPILLVFNLHRYPFSCPRAYSDRADFPVGELPHINPTTKPIPAYLCLHRGNLDDWFAEHTISDLVSRVRAWFRDAASGRLIREDDGFEPTRIADSFGICVYDDDQFSSFVEGQWKASSGAAGVSFIVADLLQDFRQDPTKDVGFALAAKFPAKDIPPELVQKAHQFHAYLAESAPGADRVIFGILLWPEAKPLTRYFGVIPGEFKGLRDFAAVLGLPLEKAVKSYEEKDLQLIGGIPIILAVPRPQKLLGANSTIEFLSFVILGNKNNRVENGTIADSAAVSILEQRRPITVKFARSLSSIAGSEDYEPRILLLGCGAQGSKIGLHLGRAGFTNIEFVDPASISPHNLVRHGLLPPSLGKNKAEALRDELNGLYYADTNKKFSAQRSSAFELVRNSKALEGVDLLLDGTASASTLDILVQSDLPERVRIVRCELTDNGQLGVLLSEGRGRNPRLDDLQAALFDLAIDNERLSAWLKHHREETLLLRGPALEEIGVGISCSSDTMRLADDVVSYHASLFSIVVRDILNCGGNQGMIQANSVTQSPLQVTSSSLPVGEVITMGLKHSKWKIRLGANAFRDLRSAHKTAGKNETGGLLVGFAHKKRKIIYVTRVLPASADSEGFPYAFRRGVQDYPEILDRIHLLTGNMLGYVGEWHTHPKGAPKASPTDLSALASISETLSAAGLPAHIIIVSPEGVSSFLAERGAT